MDKEEDCFSDKCSDWPKLCRRSCDLYHILYNKQLLDEVFVISRIIEVEVGVISRSRRLRLITLIVLTLLLLY